MLRVLEEEKIETEFPVGVINWTKYVLCSVNISSVEKRRVLLAEKDSQ